MSSLARRLSPRVCLTVDIHDSDSPGNIERFLEFLRNVAIKATFFVPTALLEAERFRQDFSALGRADHELGTHGHDHDREEITALGSGRAGDLDFLRRSAESFAGAFGYRPRVFRSPSWCGLGAAALDLLAELGYQVDSSATPQRPGLLSSFPTRNPYLFSARSPHFLRPTLLEVPTSTALIPAGAPSFQTLRQTGSTLMMQSFFLEAALFPSRVVVVQMHTGDVVGNPMLPADTKMKLADLIPRRQGGVRARKALRMRDPEAIRRVSLAVIEQMKNRGSFVSLAEVYASATARTQDLVQEEP